MRPLGDADSTSELLPLTRRLLSRSNSLNQARGKLLKTARSTFGLQDQDAFETVDLYERKDLDLVVQCLLTLKTQVWRPLVVAPPPGGGVLTSPSSQ